MNITKHIVTSANWDSGRAGHQVIGIVLHTMVGYMQPSENRFNDPNSQVSVHYGVGLDGSIRQWVEEANTAWQAGNYAVNQTTIGIEHEDAGNANDSTRTTAEYDSSSDLVADICRRYGIPCDTNHIFLHKNVIDKSKYPGGTACPDGLDTNKIINMAAAKLGGDVLTKQQIIVIYDLAFDTEDSQVNPDVIKAFTGKSVDELLTFLHSDPSWIAHKNNINNPPTSTLNKASVVKYLQDNLR